MYNVDSIKLNNIKITDVISNVNLDISNGDAKVRSFTIKNIIVDHNIPDENAIQTGIEGGGVDIGGNSFYPEPYSFYGTVINIQITRNLCVPDPMWPPGAALSALPVNNCKLDLVNATIGHNTVREEQGFAASIQGNSELNVYNSIFYGDSLKELSLGHPSISTDTSTCRVYYSNMEGGQESIKNWYGHHNLVWGPGNIDSDPLWDTTASIPYALPINSPCVDAGTPMYEAGMQPPFIIQEDTAYKLITFDYDTIALPPADLAGNPRIIGDRIDMGAYEWDTIPGIANDPAPNDGLAFQVYPNPFYANTFVSFHLDNQAGVQVLIYDLMGKEVNKLVEASLPPGKYNLTWPGDDDSGQELESGTYLVTIYMDGVKMASKKVIKQSKK